MRTIPKRILVSKNDFKVVSMYVDIVSREEDKVDKNEEHNCFFVRQHAPSNCVSFILSHLVVQIKQVIIVNYELLAELLAVIFMFIRRCWKDLK